MRNTIIAIVAILLLGYALADTYVSAVQVAVQDYPYDLQAVLGSNSVGTQDTEYDLQTVSSITSVGTQDTEYDLQTVSNSTETGTQDTVYDLQTVANTVLIFDQNATVPTVEYSATYNPDTNQTTVSVIVTSDPVPTYYVFVYDTAGNLLTSYATSNANSSTTIPGEYSKLYIVVIANSIGITGYLDLGIYPAFVVGTNIIPVRVDSIGQYNIEVYGGYAISPVYVGDAGKPLYVIATAKLVDVTVSK